jgi:hypothetical protein
MELNQEILVDYLDRTLSPDNSSQVAAQLKENKLAATELQFLQLAVDTVRRDSISQQVSIIRQSFENNQTLTVKKTTGTVRSFYRVGMRIAAIFIFVVGVTSLYKYISVNSQSLYDKQFVGYELSNSRGQTNSSRLTEAYLNKNWKEVEKLYINESVPSRQSSFLVAMADMQQNNFPKAITILENLLINIKSTGDDSYREETEYYLSLAYLMNHQVDKSMVLIHKIKEDPSHTYYPLVSKMSSIDLKIIELKK